MNVWRDGNPADPVLVLAHGSGQPADSDWMGRLTGLLVKAHLRVIRFDFEYMATAKRLGKNRPPPKVPVLVQEMKRVVELEKAAFVGGKSLGGRVASHLATEIPLQGWIAFGYPFHPPGKPDKLRTEHLPRCLCPGLVLQGERDPFGKRQEVEELSLPPDLIVSWISDGDHQLKPRKRDPATLEGNLEEAAGRTSDFMRGASSKRSRAGAGHK